MYNENFYSPGTEIEIKAIPDTGNKFVGWEGNQSGTENPFNVIVNSDLSFLAKFEQEEPAMYKVITDTIGNGTVEVNEAGAPPDTRDRSCRGPE